jgi:hypothetical protein
MATRVTQYRTPEPASLDQRAEPRLRLSVTKASIRRQGRTPIDADLDDVSVYGCRMMSQLPAEEGERLWLRFDGRMPIAATVVWSDAGMIGCRFDKPIDRGTMRALTLRLA